MEKREGSGRPAALAAAVVGREAVARGARVRAVAQLRRGKLNLKPSQSALLLRVPLLNVVRVLLLHVVTLAKLLSQARLMVGSLNPRQKFVHLMAAETLMAAVVTRGAQAASGMDAVVSEMAAVASGMAAVASGMAAVATGMAAVASAVASGMAAVAKGRAAVVDGIAVAKMKAAVAEKMIRGVEAEKMTRTERAAVVAVVVHVHVLVTVTVTVIATVIATVAGGVILASVAGVTVATGAAGEANQVAKDRVRKERTKFPCASHS
jgi:hypothetical protein